MDTNTLLNLLSTKLKKLDDNNKKLKIKLKANIPPKSKTTLTVNNKKSISPEIKVKLRGRPKS